MLPALQFLNQLMLKLREMYLMPGETLIRAGDMSRELAFVARVGQMALSYLPLHCVWYASANSNPQHPAPRCMHKGFSSSTMCSTQCAPTICKSGAVHLHVRHFENLPGRHCASTGMTGAGCHCRGAGGQCHTQCTRGLREQLCWRDCLLHGHCPATHLSGVTLSCP